MTSPYISPWTDPRIEDLKRLFNEGWTAGQIAKALTDEASPISRNAVIGKLQRLDLHRGLLQPKSMHPEAVATRARRALKAQKKPRRPYKRREQKVVADAPPIAPRPTPPRPSHPGGPRPKNLTLLQLTRDTCKYAVTESAPYQFCGHAAVEGSSWCEHHHGVVFVVRGQKYRGWRSGWGI